MLGETGPDDVLGQVSKSGFVLRPNPAADVNMEARVPSQKHVFDYGVVSGVDVDEFPARAGAPPGQLLDGGRVHLGDRAVDLGMGDLQVVRNQYRIIFSPSGFNKISRLRPRI